MSWITGAFGGYAGIGGAVIALAINALTTMLLEANSVAFLFWFLLGIGSQLAGAQESTSADAPLGEVAA